MAYDKTLALAAVQLAELEAFPQEAEAWRGIIDRAESYPSGTYIAPFKAPRRREKPRIIGAMTWEYDRPDVLSARIVAVNIACGDVLTRLEFTNDDDANAAALASVLLLPDIKGAMLATWGASEGGFHTVLRQLARPLVRAGWSVQPIATGTRCKALILRQGRRSFWLTDAQEMAGAGALQHGEFVMEYAPRSAHAVGSASRLAEALQAFQRQLGKMFGVAMHATIGSAGLRAASSFVDPRAYVWRPSPLLVTMLRHAHGFRGGYSYAEPYDGAAWSLDLNKAYIAALATPLPLRSALVPASKVTETTQGVFLCRVEGPGAMPVYLAPWRGKSLGYELEYWNGDSCLAVLASTEIEGMRALGFTVIPRGGFEFVRSWTLDAFTRRIAALCMQHGRGSAHERTAKILGNSVYGKFAESPRHEEVMYSAKRPGDGWHPMIDLRGDELPDLWTAVTTSYRPGQHVEIAATVTGRVRGWLYEGMATALGMGADVIHADTDGFLATADPSRYLNTREDAPGSWRGSHEPQRAIVWGRKAYAFGDAVKAAGFSGLTPADGAAILEGGSVSTAYTQMPAPWKSGAGIVASKRLARLTA